MSIAARVKQSGSVILSLAGLVAVVAVGAGLLVGAATFSVWVLEWTIPAFGLTLLLSILLLAPLALVPPARGLSAVGFLIASFAFGAILWIWSMAYTYFVWGFFGVAAGLLLMGVGVVPVAMFAALVHADWGNLGMFALTAVLTIGCRGLANWLAERTDQRRARYNPPEIDIQPHEIPSSAAQ
jgi:hypothetical protein